MNSRRLLRNIFFLLVIFANIGCDQISKNVARAHLDYQQAVYIIGDHFVLLKVENTGAFLSMGSHLPFFIKAIFLSVLPVLFLAFGLYYLMTRKQINTSFALGISFALGGGIGNIYDRLVYGSVTDFLYIDYYFIKTGIFNMADISIMFGMGLIVITSFLEKGIRQKIEE